MSAELVNMAMNVSTYSLQNNAKNVSIKANVLNMKLDYFQVEMTIEKIEIEVEFCKALCYEDFELEMNKELLKQVNNKLKNNG